MKNNHTVVVVGASHKPERYSNRAVKMLKERNYHVIPIHPKLDRIEDIPVCHALDEIRERVDTLTLYIGPERLQPLMDKIVTLKPGRVIFNPGTEKAELQHRLDEAGIPWLAACTLVMLQTGQF
jgi:predicted CoA-binding protein